MPEKKKYSPDVERLASQHVRASARMNGPRWDGLFKEVSDYELGARMAKFRNERGIRQNDLAAHLGETCAVVCQREKGRFHWSAEKVLAYIDRVITLAK